MPDENERQELVQIEQHVAYYSGPLPPPKMMRDYEEILPGSADRILSSAERRQRDHARYELLGLVFGFVAALALIGLSAYAIALGFAWQSVGVVIGSIAGTAGTFIYSNQARRKELREKRAALQQPSKPSKLPDATDTSVD